ncbi:MAG: indole-3-glycerol-phosphate synthase TrpC, partial [Gammaproteobacteria bacterium]|nr:indole-3-glycerol-phosphate synthase TrpC [Gammaproteobacteria bacterium]
VLLEVHNTEELGRALELQPTLLGINNRNLQTFDTTLDTTLELLPRIPNTCHVVTESGIHTKEDIARMTGKGVNSFLVGEAFMVAEEPGTRLNELFFQSSQS